VGAVHCQAQAASGESRREADCLMSRLAGLSVIALCAPWLSIGLVEAVVEQDERRSKHRILGVVGRWVEDVVDGEPAIRGEGAKDAVDATAASTIASSLFGKTDAAFIATATAPQAFALSVLPDVSGFTAGAFTAQFNLVSGASDQTAGLVFDLQPTGEYLFVRYNTREGNVALWRYAGGKREVVARTEHKAMLPLGTWHRIALRISGTRLIADVNDLRLEHDLQRAPSGRIGFWTKRDSVTTFKRIAVSN
jgi:hypothetical protein